MVVAEGPKEYILYAQNDHGDLVGQFAAHWGNEKFSPLNPRDSMVFGLRKGDKYNFLGRPFNDRRLFRESIRRGRQ
jgi:hypothetical protein